MQSSSLNFSQILIWVFAGAFAVLITSCSENENNSQPHRPEAYQCDEDKIEYCEILEGLRLVHSTQFGRMAYTGSMGLDSIKYISDSTQFRNSYDKFLAQDLDFIHWLLDFRNDTSESLNWMLISNPMDSHLSECNFFLSNERAAIVVIENFLNGDGIACIDCPYQKRDSCVAAKYESVATFLDTNEGKSIDSLRVLWRNENLK